VWSIPYNRFINSLKGRSFGERHFRVKEKRSSPENIIPIAIELSKSYKDFGHYNKKNPLDELLLILCSVKRGAKVYLRAFKSLKQAFPTFEQLNQASIKELIKQIEWGGLQNQKARSLNKITTAITGKFGKLSLAPLRKMTEKECEEFLCSLPGVGKKVAR
jgi:endonuclease III